MSISSLPNLKTTSFVLCTICLLPHIPTVRDGGETQRDILTVRIHFKTWQRANRRAAGRQIKWGPSQQVVLGQIGCDSVQPLNILPTRGGQDWTHKLSQSSSQCISLQSDFQVCKAYIEPVPNTIYLHSVETGSAYKL